MMKRLLLFGIFVLDIFPSIGFRCWNLGFRRHFHKTIKNGNRYHSLQSTPNSNADSDDDDFFRTVLPYDPDADLFRPNTLFKKEVNPFVNPTDAFDQEDDKPDFSNATITGPNGKVDADTDDFWKNVLRRAEGEDMHPVAQPKFGYNLETNRFEPIPKPIKIPINWTEVRYDLPMMLEKWNELQKENKVPKDMPFDLDLLIPHITLPENETLLFVPDIPQEENVTEEEIYTEQELKAIWFSKYPHREENEFTIEEALLLVADNHPPEHEPYLQEDDYLKATSHYHVFQEIPPSHQLLFEEKARKEQEAKQSGKEPFHFTQQELERIWESQAEIQWGKNHGKNFSEENVKQLINTFLTAEDWDYGDHEYFEASILPEINDEDDMTDHPKFNNIDGPINQDLVDYWKNSSDPRYLPPDDYFTNPEDDPNEDYDLLIDDPNDDWGPQPTSQADAEDPYDEEFYQILKDLADDLDTFEEFSNPIEREHEINEGDILGQIYPEGVPVGDSLHEFDDHLTKSLTNIDWENWHEPEKGAFPDYDKIPESWKFAAPGDTFRNFSGEQPRVWELFNFPIGPKYDPHHFDEQEDLENEKLEEEIELTEEYYARKGINISDLHPASTIRLYKEHPGLFPFTKRANQTDPIHIPEFKWENFLKDEEFHDIESYPDFVDYDRDEENWFRRISEDFKKYGEIRIPSMTAMNHVNFSYGFDPKYLTQEMFRNPFRDTEDPFYNRFKTMRNKPLKNIKIPRCWLNRPRYHNYQSIDDYNKLIVYEDIGTDDDVYEVMSLELLFDLMNLYSEDLDEENRRIDERDAIQAFLHAKKNNPDATFPVYQEVPPDMTPDKDRGIQYSSEIFESHAQYQLFPKYKSIKEISPNASWHQTTKIPYTGGPVSVIESYEWEPREDLLPYIIEPQKVEAIRPIIRYLNFEAKLLSTKDDIFIFEYFGIMRNIIPIRNSVFEMAKEFYPQIKDLRLETIRRMDQFDIMDFDWVNPYEYLHIKDMPDDLTF